MKKIILVVSVLGLVLTGCKKESIPSAQDSPWYCVATAPDNSRGAGPYAPPIGYEAWGATYEEGSLNAINVCRRNSDVPSGCGIQGCRNQVTGQSR